MRRRGGSRWGLGILDFPQTRGPQLFAWVGSPSASLPIVFERFGLGDGQGPRCAILAIYLIHTMYHSVHSALLQLPGSGRPLAAWAFFCLPRQNKPEHVEPLGISGPSEHARCTSRATWLAWPPVLISTRRDPQTGHSAYRGRLISMGSHIACLRYTGPKPHQIPPERKIYEAT